MQEMLLTVSEQQQQQHQGANAKKKKSGGEEEMEAAQCRRPPRTRRVSPAAVEKELPNGDVYSGSLWGNVPHGKGKYVWCDGCMYEGEWKKGKACGKGRFSWPSGATYEGDFVSGRMEGQGAFVGVEGDTYRGSWVSDRKHGFGEKWYANGDVYEGWWRCNLQEGEGRYVWKNGNEYVGEWKGGAISGNGVLVWKNGNRYEGCWENGVPKGKGVFTWKDGSISSGNWGNDDKRVSMTVDGSKSVTFPRICIWELDGEAGDITCDIVDNVEACMFYKDHGNESEDAGGFGPFSQRSPCCSSLVVDGDVKKPGHTVSKGHKNYDLILNLQLGIRYFIYIVSLFCAFDFAQLGMCSGNFVFFLFFLIDTVLGSMLRCRESLGLEILIRRRSSGQGSLLKGPSLHLRISLWTLGGKTTAPWCSGVNTFCINVNFDAFVSKQSKSFCVYNTDTNYVCVLVGACLFVGQLDI